MESTAISAAKELLGIFGVILACGTVACVVAKHLKVPDVVLLLIAGVLAGPSVFDWIDVGVDTPLNQTLLVFGACYILFDGGASLRLAVLKKVWVTILVISTVGVLISTVVVAAAAYQIMGLTLLTAALLGATIASTDPATLVPIFRQVPIRERVAQTIMSESAFNDATGAIATFTILALVLGTGEFSVSDSFYELLKQSALGLLIGAVCGGLASLFLAHERFAFFGEFGPLVTLMAVVAAYLGADQYHASGFMAVFVFGLIVGNKEVFGLEMEEAESQRMFQFVGEMALIMRMIIFVLLGTQVDFGLVQEYGLEAFLVVLVLIFVARPAVVYLCTIVDRGARWTWQEQLFMCWTRETGVIPAALAGMMMGLNVPGADIIASVTFMAVLVTILLQASTTPWLAGRLGLLIGSASEVQSRSPAEVEDANGTTS
jgi:cell volume regulation protein A